MDTKTKKIVLIHIPFRLGYRASGGGIRPQKIISSFKNEGIPVEVISGNHEERARAFQILFQRIRREEVSIEAVYSEAPANPTILTDKFNWWRFRDFFYLVSLKRKGIPITVFYRDIHWNVPGVFHFNIFKTIILRAFHLFDLVFYNFFVSLLVLPTERMAPFIPMATFFPRMEMPPGHDVPGILPDKDVSRGLRGLFVGGVLPPVYDISPVFRSSFSIPVTVCCRKDEWEQTKEYYEPVPANVNVIHVSGAELAREYEAHHIAVMIRDDHLYLRMNQPLKLYEAIGFEMPVLVSPGSLVADIVEELGIGWVTANPGMDITVDDYRKKVSRIREIKKDFTWDARVRDWIRKVGISQNL